MAASERGGYAGSRTFQRFADAVGLPVDQVNYLIGQFACLFVATFYRKALHPDKVSASVRHIVTIVAGVSLGFFLFGGQISHLMVQATLSYVILNTASPHIVHRLVLFVSMLYLSSAHMMKVVHGPGGWTLDITGPLMLATQKVISLAFSLHDGMSADWEKLSCEQQKHALRQRPSMLEFYSYMFHFQALVCGPLVFYNDYMDFIIGRNFTKHLKFSTDTCARDKIQCAKEPSPKVAVAVKLASGMFFAFVVVNVVPHYQVQHLADEEYLKVTPWYSKIIYMVVTTTLARSKYYVAWLLGDCICNASGLGFHGYDSNGHARWDMVSNVNILRLEFSLNFRETLECWNKSTQLWLRTIAYDRVSSHKTLVTYILSALWHGFFPGYYFTFLTGALITVAARVVRRSLRHIFLGSRQTIILYDILTCLATRVALAYVVFPFVLLEYSATVTVYKGLYFFGHAFALGAIYFLPAVLPPKRHITVRKFDAYTESSVSLSTSNPSIKSDTC